MPRASSQRRSSSPEASFSGPIIDIRFVQLADGRKILQYSRMPNVWDTPETVDVRALSEGERDEIFQAIAYHDPNYR